MVKTCVICMCTGSLQPLSVEHREILESLVSTTVNLEQLRNISLLVCTSCVFLIKTLVKFRQNAIAGLTHFLQLWTKEKKLIEPDGVLIKDEPPDNDINSVESPAMELEPEFVNLQDDVKVEPLNELKTEATEHCDNIEETIPTSTTRLSDTNIGVVAMENTKQDPLLNQTEHTAVFTHAKTTNCLSKPEMPEITTEAATNTPKPTSEPRASIACKKRKKALVLTRNERRDLVNIYNYLEATSPTYPLKGELYKATAEIMGVSEIFVRREMKKYRKSQTKLEDGLDPNPPELVCTDCNISFVNVAAYRSHRSSLRHTSKDTHTIIFECDTCRKKYSKKEQLKWHIKTKHMVMKASKCEECGKSYANPHSLWTHVRKHKTDGRERLRPFVCDVCGKAFTVKKSLTEHLYMHSGIRPYKCKECSDTFTYSAALFTHIRLKHLKIKLNKDKNKA